MIAVLDHFNPSFDAWERCNNMTHSRILNFVSSLIAQSNMYIENASDVWRDLKERYAQAACVRIAKLQHEL